MLFKIYAKSQFFQNSCMKRDQKHSFLKSELLFIVLRQISVTFSLFLFCFVSFFQMHEFKHTITFFFILQSESVSSYIKGLIDYYASSF